jgi:DNA-binding XRE family transcriptional regulator
MKKKKGRSPEDRAIMRRMGKMLRHQRLRKKADEGGKWTQAALGGRVGITSQQIGYIETGKKWPGPHTLIKISVELDLFIDELLDRKNFQDCQANGNSVKVSGE